MAASSSIDETETLTSKQTHYDVLGVTRTATYEEIKNSFHKKARQSHPDKLQQNSASNNNEEETQMNFKRIQEAWETLRDENLRATYDEELMQQKLKQKGKLDGAVLLSKHDDLEEAHDEDLQESVYVYDCRCGEELIFENKNIEEDGFEYVDCPGCCFVYKVKF